MLQIHEINCRVWQFDPPHVRTQVPQESDQDELVQPGSRFVSPLVDSKPAEYLNPAEYSNPTESFKSPESTSLLTPPIRSRKLLRGQSSPAIETAFDQLPRVAGVVNKKVTPIGEGRAYGYATN